jgi:hypothetical protein
VAVGEEFYGAGEGIFRGSACFGWRWGLLTGFFEGVEIVFSAGDEFFRCEIGKDATEFAFARAGDFEAFCDLRFGKWGVRVGAEEFEDRVSHGMIKRFDWIRETCFNLLQLGIIGMVGFWVSK